MADKTVDQHKQELEQIRCEVSNEKSRRLKAESLLKKIRDSFSSEDEEKNQTLYHAWGMVDCYFDLMKGTNDESE